MADETRREPIRSYRDLVVWQRSVDLVAELYALSRQFPSDERFGLTSQLRRAAVSIPANLSEGHSRAGRRDFNRFVAIARGSLAEVETELLIAERLGFVSPEDLAPVHANVARVGRMLTTLHSRLGGTG